MLSDWDLLRVFIEVARAGSLRRAASKLLLTQPTIGKKIEQLEHTLDKKLFYRTRSGLSLTPAGKHLVELAEEVEQRVLATSIGIDASDGLKGRLRVAMHDGMAGYWLPPRLRRFHIENPHILLDVQILQGYETVNLSRREADLTIVYDYPEDPDVVVLKTAEMEAMPVCSKWFADYWGRPTSLEDVLRFPVCTHPFHHRKEGEMRPWAEMLERHSMITYRTASSLVLGRAVREGIGLSLLPVGVLAREDDATSIDFGFRVRNNVHLVCHREVKDIPIIRKLINHLSQALFVDDDSCGPTAKSSPRLSA